MILDPEKFRNFEHAGWESIPDEYHQAFGNLTSQAIGPLLAAAAKRGATVLGVDFSAAMVAYAQQLHPSVEFRQGDAERLPLGSGLFDAAAMNFGILHLGQPEAALVEAHRVLRTGGRFAFSVWARPEETIGFGIVLRAVERHGEPRVELPEGPPFFRYSDPEECT